MQTTSNKRYYLFLCLVASLGGFLFGFDTAVISGTLSSLENHFRPSPFFLGVIVSSALAGSVLGALVSGRLSDNIGRKGSLKWAAFLFFISALGCAVAFNELQLTMARWIGGIGVGLAAMVSPLYIAEISPAAIRGRMVAIYQFSITIGILVAYFSNAFVNYTSPMWIQLLGHDVGAWRLMLGMEVIPSLSFLFLLSFIPESPRWLWKSGKIDESKKILNHILGKQQANFEFLQISSSSTGEMVNWRKLFSSKFRRPLFIALFLAIFQQFSGINAIIYYGPKIFAQAGLDVNSSLSGTVVLGLINMLFTLLAMWKVDTMGRRPLLFWGNLGTFLSLFMLGVLFLSPVPNPSGLIFFMCLFLACFAFSLGPVPWIVMSEIFPLSARSSAMSLCTVCLFSCTGIVSLTFPWLIHYFSTSSTFFLYMSCLAPVFWFVYRIMPETKGKHLEECLEIA